MNTVTKEPRIVATDEWRIELKFTDQGISAYASETFTMKGPECNDIRNGKQEGSMTLDKADFTLEKIQDHFIFGIDLGMPPLQGTATQCGRQESISQGDLALIFDGLNVGNHPEIFSAMQQKEIALAR
ncbi:MAG: hypothetical protein ACSLE0_16400 [Chitinophagaceae bacterium]